MASTLKKIMLKSSDGETFVVEEAVAMEFQMINRVFEDCVVENAIPLDLTSRILSKVLEYCKKHVEALKESSEEDLNTWDSDFVKVDQNTLFDLIQAANYLDIRSLLDLTTQTVADMIKGKTPEEIRKFFNLKRADPEEEEEIRRENQWAFE